jgi:hypothetical protein
MTVVCVATWGATAVRSLSLAGDLDGLYSAGHGWRHPGEKRASTDNVNELIKVSFLSIEAATGIGRRSSKLRNADFLSSRDAVGKDGRHCCCRRGW